MHSNHFAHVRHWVFDLDNTLYPPEAALFDQIELRMTQFVMDASPATVIPAPPKYSPPFRKVKPCTVAAAIIDAPCAPVP